jgi:hypothetical protein
VGLLKILKKRWKDSDKIIEPYRNSQTVDLGVIDVKTKKIIGLSIPENELLKDDEKWSYLKGEIEKHGWNDPYPQTLHLYYMPTKKFVVGAGGNHRTYLANQMKIDQVKALVTVFIPEHCFTSKVNKRLDAINQNRKRLDKEIKALNKWLNEKGAYRKDYALEEESLQKLCEQYDEVEEKYQILLLEVAAKNDLLPN